MFFAPIASGQPYANFSRIRIMPFGDSITFGAMSSDSAGYRSIVQPVNFNSRWVGTLDHDVMPYRPHQAIPGDGMVNMATRIGPAMATVFPHVIVLMGGINDLGLVSTATWRARHAALRTAVYAADPACRLVVLSLLPQSDPTATDAMNPLLAADVAAEVASHNVSYVDLYTAFRAFPNYATAMLADVTHPNDAGYAFISPDITNGIVAAISTLPSWVL